MSGATNTDQGLLKMVTLLHFPRAEVLATTASWLSPLGLLSLSSFPGHRNKDYPAISSPVLPERLLDLTLQLPLEELRATWAELSA